MRHQLLCSALPGIVMQNLERNYNEQLAGLIPQHLN